MKIIYSLFDGKIKGIAATVIQAVIDGSIDTHYVFTKEFYKEYENACSEDNDMNEDQIYDDIIPDWIYSLDYINEIRALKKDVSRFLFAGQCLHSRTSLCELSLSSQLLCGIRFLLQVTRLADTTGTQSATAFLEIRVRVLANFALVKLYHVNRFVLCHCGLT